MGSLERQGWCQMLLEHLLCARPGWGQSQIQGVRYGTPPGFEATQKISPEMGCCGTAAETEANDTARPIRAGALPLASPVPHSCRAKGLSGTRRAQV